MSSEFESGFFVRKPAWHQLGNVLPDFPSDWDEARRLAGLDWEPVMEPTFIERPLSSFPVVTMDNGAQVPDLPEGAVEVPGDRVFVKLEGTNRITRTDDRSKTLGTGSDKLAFIWNRDLGAINEALIAADGNINFEAAGSLAEGRKVWTLARLDEPVNVKGDPSPIYPYLAILNHHDGMGACKAVNTTVRVVCANTFSAADSEGDRTGRQFTFKHKGDVMARVEEARLAIMGLRSETAEWIDHANALALITFTQAQEAKVLGHFLSEFIPEPPAGLISDRVAANIATARGEFTALYSSVTCEGIRGSAYGLVQAAGEYLDHVRTYRSGNTYLNRTLLRPEPLKAKAIAIAERACASV